MPDVPLTLGQEKAIRRALDVSWPTQSAFYCEIPQLNMCRQTAVVVCEEFGGEILRTEVPTVHGFTIEHFYNWIGGQPYDFTKEQFLSQDFCNPVMPPGVPSTISDVASAVQANDLRAMSHAFSSAVKSKKMPPDKPRERTCER
jgi:hypothetical protein